VRLLPLILDSSVGVVVVFEFLAGILQDLGSACIFQSFLLHEFCVHPRPILLGSEEGGVVGGVAVDGGADWAVCDVVGPCLSAVQDEGSRRGPATRLEDMFGWVTTPPTL
jgi:hypothetical protein